MMRFTLLLCLTLLAACATPLERCVSQAERAYRDALKEDRELSETMARGYEIRRERVPYQRLTRCETEEGERYACWETAYRWVERSISVDLNQIRRRKAEIAARLPTLQAAAQSGGAQCRAAYAEAG